MSSEPTQSPLPGTPEPTQTATVQPVPVDQLVTAAQFNDGFTVIVFLGCLVVALLGILVTRR